MKKIIAAAVLLASLAFAAPASAQNVEARNPASLEAALTKAGYTVELVKDSVGEPMLKVKSEALTFGVLFYGCKDKINCTTVSLFAAFSSSTKPSLQAINAWNSNKRFGRAYADKDGDPALQLDIDLDDGGMSPALFVDNVEWFIAATMTVRKDLVK